MREHPLGELPGVVGAGGEGGLEFADLLALGADGFFAAELPEDLVLIDREGFDAILVETGGEFTERNACVLRAALVEQHEQHDGERDEQHPAEEAAPKAQSGVAVRLSPTVAAAAPVLAVAGAVRSLFGHR